MLFNVSEIDWDTETDDDKTDLPDLPETLTVELDDKYGTHPLLNISLSNEQEYEDIIEDIINQLSDIHGWCVKNCRITRIQ